MGLLLAIDIGTTNIEYEIFGDINKTFISKNACSKYGLDVMTRIDKANLGLLHDISATLRNQIKSETATYKFDSIYISANTTMIHLLMGYSCENLGKYPFSPVHTEAIKTTDLEIGIGNCGAPVYITRGLSAFVGGDIVSGLSTLPDNCRSYLFLDLGTNAEMVLSFDDTLYITSAAAGPAFETHSKGYASRAIDGLVQMLKMHIIDDTGLMDDEYFDKGYTYSSISFVRNEESDILFTQKKIRDLQMAKSAVRTGIDLLLREANVSAKDLDAVYLAGAFGSNINIYNACTIGLLPDTFKTIKISALGNTSLRGAKLHTALEFLDNKKIREIYLNTLPDFNHMFIENMNF